MKTKFLPLFFSFLFIATLALAQPALITFDELPPPSSGTLVANGYFEFDWTDFYYLDATATVLSNSG